MNDPIGFLLADAARLYRRALDDRARTLGVTSQQWRALALISRRPGSHQGMVADILEMEPITVSRMIDRLQEAGLIERRADPNDRRAWRLYLTEAAQPVIQQIRQLADDVLGIALESFSPTDVERLTVLAERFRDNLGRRDGSSTNVNREDRDAAA